MKARFKVGCVPYVNARPLVACFDQPNPFVEVVYDVPSRLPALLDAGEVDAILVSSIEYLRREDLIIASDVGIMSNGPVASVRLLSKVPLEQIQTLALDQSSMTSNMLAQIILAEQGVRPQLITMEPNQRTMLATCDACVLIGDKGLEADGTELVDVDLGEAWTKLTRQPFTWALWLSKRDRFANKIWYERDPNAQLSLILQYAYESSGFAALHEWMDTPVIPYGILDGPGPEVYIHSHHQRKERSDNFESRRDWIIFEASRKSGWTPERVRDYLTINVRFKDRDRGSLKAFSDLLLKHKLVPEIAEHARANEESNTLIHAIYALNPGAGLSREI